MCIVPNKSHGRVENLFLNRFLPVFAGSLRANVSCLKNNPVFFYIFVVFLFLMYFCDKWTLAFVSVLFMFDKLRTPKGFVI